jgi:hypothetical protein
MAVGQGASDGDGRGATAKPCLHDSLDDVLCGWLDDVLGGWSVWQQQGEATEGAPCVKRSLSYRSCFFLVALIDVSGVSADDVAAGQVDRGVWLLGSISADYLQTSCCHQNCHA